MLHSFRSLCLRMAFVAGFILLAASARGADRAAPRAPRLVSPPDEALFHNFPRRVTFQWREVSDRSGVVYYLQVDTYFPARSGYGEWQRQVFGPLTQTTYEYSHLGDQAGRWQVWAVDGAGNQGPASEERYFNFDTSVAEGQPSAAQPFSRFDRQTPMAAAPLGPTPAPAVRATPPVMRPVEALENTDYWSRVLPQLPAETSLVEDLVGSVSPFATGPGDSGLPAPALSAPAAGARLYGYPCEVNLRWQPVGEGASVTYTVEVQTVFPFEGGGSADRSQFYRGLSETSILHRHPGDYAGRWRVWAVDDAGRPGQASAWRSFTFETDQAQDRKDDLAAVQEALAAVADAPVPARLGGPVAPLAGAAGLGSAVMAPRVTPRPDAPQAVAETESVPAPVQTEPPDGAIIDDDENYVICRWEGILGARFTLEVQTYDAATGTWDSDYYRNLVEAAKTANHQAPLRGRWRVMQAYMGVESPWSPWRNFTYHGEGKSVDPPEATSRPLPFAQLAAQADEEPPPVPALDSPADEAVVAAANRRVDLSWTEVRDPSGVSYICVVETPGEAGQWKASKFPGLQEPSLPYQNPRPGRARWWVLAVDGAGNVSDPSPVRELIFEPGMAAAPDSAVPQPLAPTTGAAVAPGDVNLDWASDGGTHRVEVQVLEPRAVGGGQWKQAVERDVAGTQLTVQIAPDYEVRWRVGRLEAGVLNASPWQYFRTGK